MSSNVMIRKANVIFKYSVIAVIIALCSVGGGLLIKNVVHYNNAINVYESVVADDESFLLEFDLNDTQKEKLTQEINFCKKQLSIHTPLLKRNIVAMVFCFTTVAVIVVYCCFEIITAIRRKRRK